MKAKTRGGALTNAQHPGAALTSLKRSGRLPPPPLSCIQDEASFFLDLPAFSGVQTHGGMLGGDRVRIRIEKGSARNNQHCVTSDYNNATLPIWMC